MGKAFDVITPAMKRFIESQSMFFVATAPAEGGRVNMSPKGYDSFRIIDETTVAYLDLTGSGAETVAHLRDDGRITFMFCSFDDKANIIRLYGTGQVLVDGDPAFLELSGLWETHPGARAIITATIDRTSFSCGFGIPRMDLIEDRSALNDWSRVRTRTS